jgi:hypothetical protein
MAHFPQTQYFRHTRLRPDRQGILDEWIEQAVHNAFFDRDYEEQLI